MKLDGLDGHNKIFLKKIEVTDCFDVETVLVGFQTKLEVFVPTVSQPQSHPYYYVFVLKLLGVYVLQI